MVSSAFGFLYAFRQRALLEEEQKNHGQEMAEILAGNMRLGLFSGRAELLEESVSGMLGRDDVLHVAVYSTDGRLFMSEGKPEIENLGEFQDVVLILKDHNTPVVFTGKHHHEFWAPVLYIRSSISSEDFFPESSEDTLLLGLVKLSLSKESMNKAVQSIMLNAVFVTLMFIIIGGIMAYYVSSRATNSLNDLMQDIREMERDGLKRIDLKGDAEFVELASAFNSMADTLITKESAKQKAVEEKHEMERMYLQAQKLEALGKLSGGIAHDFNNILAIILSNIELIKIENGNNVIDHIQRVNAAVNRGRDMVKNILSAYCNSSADIKPINMGELVGETVILLSTEVDEKIHVNIEEATGTFNVSADPIRLQQMLMNLYTNAVAAIKSLIEKGVDREFYINFKVEDVERLEGTPSAPDDKFIRLAVSDNGCGMEEETISQALKPFFTTKGSKGSGIGLSMVDMIAKEYGGYIDIQSKPGEGTSVLVYLLKHSVDIPKKSCLSMPPEIVSGSETILFVDDEPNIANATSEMLRHLGYNVLVAYSGTSAYSMFSKDPESIDLVILDLIMPGLSGIDLLSKIKKIRPEIKTIICSGSTNQLSKKIDSMVEATLCKPFPRDEMASVIRNVLEDERS